MCSTDLVLSRRYITDWHNLLTVDPVACFEETLTRLDSELCSLGLGDLATLVNSPTNPFDSPDLSRDLRHVAQSGAVGLFGHLYWDNKPQKAEGDDDSQETTKKAELQIANVGDCSAVLLSAVDESGKFVGKVPLLLYWFK